MVKVRFVFTMVVWLVCCICVAHVVSTGICMLLQFALLTQPQPRPLHFCSRTQIWHKQHCQVQFTLMFNRMWCHGMSRVVVCHVKALVFHLHSFIPLAFTVPTLTSQRRPMHPNRCLKLRGLSSQVSSNRVYWRCNNMNHGVFCRILIWSESYIFGL